MIIRSSSKVIVHAPHQITADELCVLIDEDNHFHENSFTFKVVGGRKTYNYIGSAWRPHSDKVICVGQSYRDRKHRWLDPDTKLQIIECQ